MIQLDHSEISNPSWDINKGIRKLLHLLQMIVIYYVNILWFNQQAAALLLHRKKKWEKKHPTLLEIAKRWTKNLVQQYRHLHWVLMISLELLYDWPHYSPTNFIQRMSFLYSGTICGTNRYFRTNNPMEGRTMSRTNLSQNGFSEALLYTHSFKLFLFFFKQFSLILHM